MKSVFLLCGALGAVANASECQADEHSLLQATKTVRKHAQTDSKAVLKKLQDVANSLLEGSDATVTSDEVNDALEAASNALAQLSPAIRQQIENAQEEISDAISAVYVCHSEDQVQLRSSLQDNVQRRTAAFESCQDTLGQLRADETRQCGIAEDCLCDEARVRTTGQEAVCASMTETYEEAFCEHHYACATFHQCHEAEAGVFAALRADVEAEMAIIVQEYIAVEQSQCLTGLIMQATTPPMTPISHAALIACDDVDVSALEIDYPDLPSEPAACPAHSHGNPQCVIGVGEPLAVDNYIPGANCCGFHDNPNFIAFGNPGLVGHHWRNLEVTFEFTGTPMVQGVRVNDFTQGGYTAFTSMDRSNWNRELSDVHGEQSFASPRRAKYGRLVWDNTRNVNGQYRGIHAEFLGTQ